MTDPRILPFAEPSRAFRVLLIERDGLLADLLAAHLQTLGRECQVVHTMAEAAQALREGPRPDVVLVEIAVEPSQNYERAAEALHAAEGVPMIAFTGLQHRSQIEEALNAGFRGFISKGSTLRSLIHALDFVASGETYLPQQFFQSSSALSDAPLGQLTDTEQRILSMIQQGMLNKEIALELGRSEIGVKMQVRSICAKLGARNRTEAAMIAARGGRL